MEQGVEGGVADEEGGAFVDDLVADGIRDAEAFATVGAGEELAVFDGHEDAAFGVDGLEAEVEDHLEEFVEGAEAGEFFAGFDEGIDAPGGEVGGLGRGRESAGGEFGGVEAEDDGGGGGGLGVGVIDEFEGGPNGVLAAWWGLEGDDEVAGGDGVSGGEGLRLGEEPAVDGGAVFAAEVADGPAAVEEFEGEVEARQHGVGGRGESGRIGATHNEGGFDDPENPPGAILGLYLDLNGSGSVHNSVVLSGVVRRRKGSYTVEVS